MFRDVNVAEDCEEVDLTGGDYDNTANDLKTVLYVGTGGDITLTLRNSTVPVTYKNVPSGKDLLVDVKTIFQAGTTASDLIIQR